MSETEGMRDREECYHTCLMMLCRIPLINFTTLCTRRERDRDRDRQTHRDRERERHTQRDRQRHTERQTETETEKEKRDDFKQRTLLCVLPIFCRIFKVIAIRKSLPLTPASVLCTPHTHTHTHTHTQCVRGGTCSSS